MDQRRASRNRGFNDLARRHIAEPLRRTGGTLAPVLFPFLASGVIHELVISVPARGGYGLPTAYFVVQAAGVLMERSRFGKKLQLRRGARGRLFTLVVTAAPLGALFHPPFVSRVMLPFLKAIGAL